MLEAFAENSEDELSVPDIVRTTGVSKRAAYIHVRQLLEEGVLAKSSKRGKCDFYTFDEEDPRGTALTFLESVLVLGRLERQIRIDEAIPFDRQFPYRWFYRREPEIEPQMQLTPLVGTPTVALRLKTEGGPTRRKVRPPFSPESASDTAGTAIRDYLDIVPSDS